MNSLSPEEQQQGWQLMFDGRTTDGWRGYRMDSVPSGWKVVDGTLSRVGGGGDLMVPSSRSWTTPVTPTESPG
jgi:hypothetical protein